MLSENHFGSRTKKAMVKVTGEGQQGQDRRTGGALGFPQLPVPSAGPLAARVCHTVGSPSPEPKRWGQDRWQETLGEVALPFTQRSHSSVTAQHSPCGNC